MSEKVLGRQARAVVDALLPSDPMAGSLPGALEAGFDRFYAEFGATADIRLRRAFSAAVFVAAWISPLLIARRPPLSALSAGDRERALDALGTSRFAPLRQLLVVLKTVVSLGYGRDRRVRQAIGHR